MKRLVLLILLAGCSNGTIQGIPCTEYNDLECPTGYWCKSDLLVNTRWVCVNEEEVEKPSLEFVGAIIKRADPVSDLPDSAYSKTISVDRNYAEVVMRIRNNGGTGRLAPQPPVTSDCCLSGPGTIGLPAIATIGRGEDFHMAFDVRRISVDCEPSVPFVVDVRESEAGVDHRFEFEMVLEPYIDTGECDGCDYRSSSNCE